MGKVPGEPRLTRETMRVLGVVLADLTADWYGLELARLAELKPGTIYPILVRLEQAGWLTSVWEDVNPSEEGRPRRRLYRLSGEGQRVAPLRLQQELQRIAPTWRPGAKGGLASA